MENDFSKIRALGTKEVGIQGVLSRKTNLRKEMKQSFRQWDRKRKILSAIR